MALSYRGQVVRRPRRRWKKCFVVQTGGRGGKSKASTRSVLLARVLLVVILVRGCNV